MYETRFYRKDFSKGWFSYEIAIKETDILVKSKEKLDSKIIYALVKRYRGEIEGYIEHNPVFKTTLSSFSLKAEVPSIIKEMVDKTSLLDVGPMASVAGAIAEYLGKELLKFSSQLIVENGGDIFIKKEGKILLGIYAGEGHFINNFLLSIENKYAYLGVCSSSSFLGHSLSLGGADLAMAVSDSVIFADSLATKLANMVNEETDIDKALSYARNFPQTKGVLIVRREKVGLWGELELIEK